MTITTGTRLGAYEVRAPLGAGGMGEVYRATDCKLGRDVAIKVLPADVAHDPERLARFEREARLLASLNHPNIAAIYGLERADGVPFVALELVEGEDRAGGVVADRAPHRGSPVITWTARTTVSPPLSARSAWVRCASNPARRDRRAQLLTES
jgi:serine/threonine protein kinase